MSVKRTVVIILVLFAGACRSQAQPQNPAAAGPDHVIAYAADVGLARDIFVMRQGGSGEVNLTKIGGISGFDDPVWSPDGTWIAMNGSVEQDEDDIYIIKPDGTGLFRLSDHPERDFGPVWSPAGDQIAFTTNRDDHNDQVFLVDRDGNNLLPLTKQGINAEQPAWSPDGKWIALSYEYELVLINPETGEFKQLTQLDDGHHKYPSWSPDGTALAFIAGVEEEGGKKWPQIFLINPDGSNIRQLTNQPFQHRMPVWSPDGTRIAFKGRPDTKSAYSLWVINSDGSSRLLLSEMLSLDYPPSWSPDSSQLTFAAAVEGRTDQDIFLINADGTDLIRLTDSEKTEAFPDWRP